MRVLMKAYDDLYERHVPCRIAPTPSAMHDASRFLVAYSRTSFICIEYSSTSTAVALGYRRHPFTTRAWAYRDIDKTPTSVGKLTC